MSRIDIIGQNGNDGQHYDIIGVKSSVICSVSLGDELVAMSFDGDNMVIEGVGCGYIELHRSMVRTIADKMKRLINFDENT